MTFKGRRRRFSKLLEDKLRTPLLWGLVVYLKNYDGLFKFARVATVVVAGN